MTASSSGVDARLYRDVAGAFATGVTVVTTEGAAGPRGMTANAVASVSLEPTLFLVCIDRGGGMLEAVSEAGRFAVNVLASDQEEASRFFAQPNDDANPMGAYGYTLSELGSPLLDGALAWLDCRTHSVLDGGDHEIYIGEVMACEIARPDADPLLFFRGGYRDIMPQN